MEVYIISEDCRDYIKDLAAYNSKENLGEQIYINNSKIENTEITIEDFWFLAV